MELKRAIKKIPSEQNLRLLSSLIISLANKVDSTSEKCINPFTPNTAYAKGSYVTHDNYIYESKIACNDADWVESHWVRLSDTIEELTVNDVKNFLSLTQEQLDTLASIISTEVRLDKCFSSSDTYTRIQEALKESKEYCLKQLASKSTGSFKKVNNTTEVTDGNYLYLILNPSTSKYDIYALVDSNVELLTSVDVNLDDYYTKTEMDNDFLKKTDATSTYATITTVDGKVDKTDIITAKDNSATDDQVYSAKVMNTELDGVVKKTDISTNIGGTSTDDKVPSAKAIFNSCIQGKIIDQSVIDTYGTEILKYPLGRWLIVPNIVAEKFKDLPVKQSGHIDITSIAYNDNNPWTAPFTYRVCSYVPYSGGNYVRKMESGDTAGVVSDTGWQKVRTTRVEDKNSAEISSFVDTDVSGTINYRVKNGICFVKLWGVQSTKVGKTKFLLNNSSLPIPSCFDTGNALFEANGDGATTAFAFVDANGALIVHFYKANSLAYGSFSYPVAE